MEIGDKWYPSGVLVGISTIGDFTEAFSYLKSSYKKVGDKLCSRTSCNSTRGNSFKLKVAQFCWDIRKSFFISMVRNWNRFCREVVDVSPLEIFEVVQDGALSNLIKWKVSLPISGRLEKLPFKCSFHSKLFYASVIVYLSVNSVFPCPGFICHWVKINRIMTTFLIVYTKQLKQKKNMSF